MPLTSNDKQWGPCTYGPWTNHFEISLNSSSNDYDPAPRKGHILLVGFGWALQIPLPWDLRRPGTLEDKRNGEAAEFIRREWGINLSKLEKGGSWDWFYVAYGDQTWSSSTTKKWCTHLPWTQWDHIRHTLYTPTGEHFYTSLDGRLRPWPMKDPTETRDAVWDRFREDQKAKDDCPASTFTFLDYDGEEIIATCVLEEREWEKGTGRFRWLRFFYKPLVKRSLDISFNKETGPEKGSWKGGTIGTGCDVLPGETPEAAFRRYLNGERTRKGRSYKQIFVCAGTRDNQEASK